MGKVIDLTGQKYGRLSVIKRVENSKHHASQWLCMCDCGKEVIRSSNSLRTGHSISCGCARKESTRKWLERYNTKHGMARSRLYVVWSGMKGRTTNPNNTRYADYGGRGIKVCKEWLDFATFQKWAIENGYDEHAKYGDCTLDRINVDGNYEPTNCRWVNLVVQARNKRRQQ